MKADEGQQGESREAEKKQLEERECCHAPPLGLNERCMAAWNVVSCC